MADIFEVYQNLGLIALSLTLTVKSTDEGYKKDPKFPKAWQTAQKTNIDTSLSGCILRTGEDAGIFAIDIDNAELEHNKKLMYLMEDCNMKQKTTKGYHYVYKWDPRVKTTANKELALDTRANGGCIFCEPSHVKDPEGNTVGKWEWLKYPDEGEEISTVPEEVIDYLIELGGDLYISKPQVSFVEQEKDVDMPDSPDMSETSDPGDINVLYKVLDGLHIKRYTDYTSWIQIGFICHNEDLGLAVWDTFSGRADNYEAGACAKHWISFKDKRENRLTQATLWKWLKEDNPDLFYSLQADRKQIWEFIELLNHNDVAEYFYSCNPDNYLYNEKLRWYTLKSNSTWDKSDSPQPSGMKRAISDTMQQLIMDLKKTEVTQYAKKSLETTDREVQDKLLKTHKSKMSLINKAYKTLGSSEFCNGVISYLPSYYEKKDLENIMDMNRDLFAFSDGVFDCVAGRFRPIQPKDYLSITTGYPYPKKSCPEVRQKIKEVLHGMFEDADVERHLLSVLASCLYGRNKWEEFYVWTGTGRNGKGMLATLLERVFGKYYMAVDMKLFTKQGKSRSEPNPTLVEARTARLMIASEADAKEKLQTAFVKGISGNDAIVVRTLHSPVEYTYVPQFKVILQFNTLPELSELQQAVMARMKIIHFPFSFHKPEDMHLGDPSKNKIQDPNLKEFCEKSIPWRDEMALLLSEIYSEIKDLKALPLPSKVKEASNEYFDTNNPVKAWLSKYYEKTGDETDRISSSDLKKHFMYATHLSEMNDTQFKTLMNVNQIFSKRYKNGFMYFGIKKLEQELEITE